MKRISETIKIETKKRRGRFLCMSLGVLGASLLENLLTGKGIIRAVEGIEGVGRAGYGSSIKKKALTPSHPLINF